MVKDLRVIDGKVVDLTEAAATLNDKQRQLNETTRLALMLKRIERAIGHRFDQRIALGALYIIIADIINYSPPEKHGLLLKAMMDGVTTRLWQLYPDDLKERALAAQKEAAEKEAANTPQNENAETPKPTNH
jgi:hypothetical protein